MVLSSSANLVIFVGKHYLFLFYTSKYLYIFTNKGGKIHSFDLTQDNQLVWFVLFYNILIFLKLSWRSKKPSNDEEKSGVAFYAFTFTFSGVGPCREMTGWIGAEGSHASSSE